MSETQNTEPDTTMPKPRISNTQIMAHIVSDVFSPLLMAPYAMLVALWLTPMNRLPLDIRIWSTIGVFILTTIIPTLLMVHLLNTGRISDPSVPNRRKAYLLFLIAVICYLCAATFIWYLEAPVWLVSFLIGAAIIALFETIISYKWKISAHLGASGGLLGFVFWLAKYNALIGDPFFILSGIILLVGIITWSRLYLHRHTLAQLIAGGILGFATELILLSSI